MTNHLLYYSCRHKAETGTICWHNKNHGFIFLITNIPLFAMKISLKSYKDFSKAGFFNQSEDLYLRVWKEQHSNQRKHKEM